MKRRLTILLYALIVAFVLHQIATGCVLAVQSWRPAREMDCTLPGAPISVEEQCRLGVFMVSWGMR